MSWTTLYRIALHLLPSRLRLKHGGAMEALFARDLERARAMGTLHGAIAGMTGVCDVLRRGAYEHARSRLGSTRARRDPPPLTTRQLLRRHAISFATAFVALTAALLSHFATKQLLDLRAPGTSSFAVAEALLLAVPFISALTIPMAVLVAVLWEFTRLDADGALDVARRNRAGVRRLVIPVLAAAVGVAALEFVVAAEVVPRANARLVTVLAQRETAPSDRMMTIGELRDAARKVRPSEPFALARAARYEVEIQKKLALPAACVILALTAMGIALGVSRHRAVFVTGASLVVFGAYYALMITGEGLANRLVVSPFVGMWGANAVLLGIALITAWGRRTRLTHADAETTRG
jgi:lipopolysaccharide export LptBFGC system permease protein LptF